MVICLQRGANDLHMVQLIPLPTSSLASLKSRMASADLPNCPGNDAIRRLFLFRVC